MTTSLIRLNGGTVSLIMDCTPGLPPALVYWGKRLDDQTTDAQIEALLIRPGSPGTADIPLRASLAMEAGLGLTAPLGLGAHRAGRQWGHLCVVTDVDVTGHTLRINCHDKRTGVRLFYEIELDAGTGVFALGTVLRNDGADVLDVTDFATASLPIPHHLDQIVGFGGRWAREFAMERVSRPVGSYVRENWRGRTSHQSFPALILCDSQTGEHRGEAYALHLAWSGNHRLRVDTLSDGRVFAMLGAAFFPGELRLQPGEQFAAPPIVAAYSPDGLTPLSQSLHAHVRDHVLRATTRARPRPVHYNSWEAVYFDHDLDQLKAIANRAADLGVERFVLDDGWFGSRRDDTSGLGDWTVSADVYPEGLGPLIKHVTGLGMEMGIWFEPEMVNPDSDLYRAHADWALEIEGVDQIPFRNQLVLDLSRPEVADYLFERIDAILTEFPIGYIKWDMNRDLSHPGNSDGQPRAAAQVRAVYALLDRLREKHPTLEIESCSSGGARIDYGILAHTDRVWTSDSNDALDRQRIQRGASLFLPFEVLGAHVGPAKCHMTGRVLPIELRTATALMGHMGLELNLLTEPQGDMEVLKAGIALYKEQRELLHKGHVIRLETPAFLNGIGVIADDRAEALYSITWLAGHDTILPPVLRLSGLDRERAYRLTLVWPQDAPTAFPQNGMIATGDGLMQAGFQLPLCRPETALLFHLVAE